ncbi:MAG: glycosyltransferase family 39 protein [Leptospiraceae bacterium]
MLSGIKEFFYFSSETSRWKPYTGLAAILGILHLMKLAFSLDGQLHPDEAYYWAWSQMPALSYYDQGPGIAYYIWLWTALLGDHYITLKLAALFASFVTIYMFCLAGLELGFRRWQPVFTGTILFFIPGILGGNHLIMHDSMMILSWSGALWMALRAIRLRSSGSLLGLFLFLGLGGLSKYTMFLFAIGLILWLILHPRFKEFWIRPASWAGLVLAGLIISPIVIWNYQNHWDGVGAIIHLRSSGGVDGGGSTTAYLAGQFLMFSPIWLILLIALSSLLSFRRLRGVWNKFGPGHNSASELKTRSETTEKSEPNLPARLSPESEETRASRHLLWIMTGIPFLFFAFLSGSREIQANWVFPAYGSAILLIVHYLFPVVSSRTFRLLRGLFHFGWLPVLLLDLFFLFSIPLSVYLPIETYLVPGYRTLGFKEVIQGVEDVQKKHPTAALVANRYQDASIGWFYNKDQTFVPSINIMQRNQFSYWPGLEEGQDYLFYHIQENTCEKSVAFLGVILPTFFEEVIEYPEQEVVRNRRVIKRYQVWYARDFKNPWDQGVFEYLKDEAIYQNMVGLRVPRPGQVVDVNDAFQKFSELWMRIYMSRKGKQNCSYY